MSYDIYLSFSGRKTYLVCPGKYEFQYISKPVVDEDVRNTIFGKVIGKVFEWFYRDKWWSDEDPEGKCLGSIDDAILSIEREYSKRFNHPFTIDFDSNFRLNLVYQVKETIPSGLSTIRKHKLLSPRSFAEVDMSVIHKSEKHGLSLKLGGKSDFVHVHSDSDVHILDGKASKYRDMYVDADQLLMYGFQWYLKYHVVPTKLGFIFWLFPEDPISWIQYDGNSLRDFVDKTYDVAKKIKLKQFPKTPSRECKLCQYKPLCPEGQAFDIDVQAAKNKFIEDDVIGLDEM